MKRSGTVLFKNKPAGVVWQDDDGYGFQYNQDYVDTPFATPVSLTLPVRSEVFTSNNMLPFFDR